MSTLSKRIADTKVENNTLALFWLAQAGFVFKNSSNHTVYIDPYFSNVVEKKFGFRRQMACPMTAEEVDAYLFVCTHKHLDHMDVDALPAIAENIHTQFIGPLECVKHFRTIGIREERCHLLAEGQSLKFDGIEVHGVFADHGELAPDAIGIIFDFGGIRVYHTGDTAYRPEQFAPAIALQPDILLPCINGKFGNMDAHEAALLTQAVNPRLVIPTHFGMFAEQNGDVGAFLQQCARLAPEVDALLMEPGGEYLFRKTGVESANRKPIL